MEIACPQCSMQYALDPKLLPAGGIPVECSRCRHVFIAAPELEAAPKPSAAPNPNLKATLPYGGPGKAIGTTQAFGVPVPQVPSIAPLAPVAKPAPAAKPPAPQTTQVFGVVTPGPPAVPPVAAPRPQPTPARTPAPQATQVFGAVPVPKPPAAKPPVGTPAPQTTQVFGVVPQPQPQPRAQGQKPPGSDLPGSPVAPRPQPARTPPGTPPRGTPTQQAAPGAKPAAGTPAPQTTQVFGAVPQQPSTAPTQLFGEAPLAHVDTPRGAPPAQPAATGPASAQPPGMTPRATTPEPLLVGLAPSERSEPMVGVAATTPIELPDEVLDQLNRPMSELLAEDSSSEARPPTPGPSGPGLPKPLELPTELLDGSIDVNKSSRDKQRPEQGRKGRGLFIAGGVLVLALTAFLTSPAWLSKSDTLPHDARVTRDEAVALLRRDDAGSKEDAVSRLRALSAAHPQSVELLAELGVAVAMHLDDTQARAATLQARMDMLQSRITRLTEARAPADWHSRVNTMGEELNTLRAQLTPLQERAKALSKDAVQAMKQLESAPEKESKEAAQARLRGRALLTAVLGGDALNMVVQLAQVGQGDWSTLTMAEYVLHYASPEPPHIAQAVTGLEGMRESDKAYLRPYVLGARIALMRKEPPAQAQSLLDTVLTLNPKHELAGELHAYAQELVTQASEDKDLPRAPAPEPVAPTPAPAPEGGDASPAPAPSESTATTAPSP